MVTYGLESITSAEDRSTQWPVDHTCSAKADAIISPFLMVYDDVRAVCGLDYVLTVQCIPYRSPNMGFGILSLKLRWLDGIGSLG